MELVVLPTQIGSCSYYLQRMLNPNPPTPAIATKTVRASRRAAARLALGVALRWTGVGVVAGSVVAFAGAAFTKVDHWALGAALRELGWPVVVGVPVLAGALTGAMLSIVRWPSARRGAAVLDDALSLQSRLSTALELSERGPNTFETLAIADAERVAERVSVRGVIPVRIGRAWWAPVPIIAAAIAVWAWAPAVALWKVAPQPRTPVALAAPVTQEAKDAVQNASKVLEEYADTSAAKQLDALKQVEQELAKPDASRGNMMSAARAVGEAADQVQRRADEQDRRQRDLTQKLANAARDDVRASPQMQELANALRAQDAEAAAKAAQELSQQMDQLPPEERAKVEKQVQELAQAMDQWEKERSEREQAGKHEAAAASAGNDAPKQSAGGADGKTNPAGDSKETVKAEAADKTDTANKDGGAGDEKVSPSVTPQAEPPQPVEKPAPPKGDNTAPSQTPPKTDPQSPADANPPSGTEQTSDSKDQRTPPQGQPPNSQPRDGTRQPQPDGKTPADATSQPDSKPQPDGKSQSGSKPQPDAKPQPDGTPPPDAKQQPGDGVTDRKSDVEPTPGGQDRAPPQGQKPDSVTKPSLERTRDPGAQPREIQPQSSQPQSKPADAGQTPQEQRQPPQTDPKQSVDQSPAGQQRDPAAAPSPSDKTAPAHPDSAKQDSQGQAQKPDEQGASQSPPTGDRHTPDAKTPQNSDQKDQRDQASPQRGDQESKGDPKTAQRKDQAESEAKESGQTKPQPSNPSESKPATDSKQPEKGEKSPDDQTKSGDKQQEPQNTGEQTSKDDQPGTPKQLPSREVLEKLAEQLKNSDTARKQAQEMMKQSQGLRDQAQKLLEQSSPEQREAMEKLARELAQDAPHDGQSRQPAQDGNRPDGDPGANNPNGSRGPSLPIRRNEPGTNAPDWQTVPVDARHSNPAGPQRVISDLLNEKPRPDGAGPISTSSLEQGIRQAAEGAESGIENQTVPQERSDLVRRVFQRYQQRVNPKPPATSPATPGASSATPTAVPATLPK